MTLPFGAALETALKGLIQNGKFSLAGGFVRNPRFFCCISGNPVGVDKAPVALLVVRPIRVCTATAVTADYSRSWSPTSTINAWQVNWGDGNVSNGVWPGAGSVNHPLGGYVLPGIYTVTLTVTDLLGATDVDTQQIEVLDCTVMVLPMFAGCGASGVWYSGTGGIGWEERGGGVLDGVEIYDLKASPFTIATYDRAGNPNVSNVLLWAATANGLYRSPDGGISWQRITLPDPAGGAEEPVVYAIQPSTVLDIETYFLALKASTNEAFVFRGLGIHRMGWSWQKIGTPNLGVNEQVIGFASTIPDFVHLNNVLYALELGVPVLWVRDPVAQTWAAVPGYPVGHNIRRIITGRDGNNIWGAGSDGAGNRVLFRYNPTTGWNTFSPGVGGYDSITQLADGRLCCGTGAGMTVDFFSTNGAFLGSTGAIGGFDPIRDITHDGGTLLAATWLGGTANVYRWTGLAWVLELTAPTNGVQGFLNYEEVAYISLSVSPYIRRREGILWVADEGQPVNGLWISQAYDENRDEYDLLGTDDVGVLGQIHIRDDSLGWMIKYAIPPTGGQHVNYDDGDFIYSLPGVAIRRADFGNAVIPTVGRHHLMAMSSDGEFVYVALLNTTNQPVVFRLKYDLQIGPDVIHNPAAGTWGGVRADWFYMGRLWIFGDFGAASKVLVSEEWGNGFVDVTDAGWGAGEIVRPILPSLYDPDNVIAILNTALQAHESSDIGASWANNGAIAFACHCAERDWIEDMNLWIGHAGPAPTGANHLQYTPNLGISWIERSTGLTADAPITSLQVVG